MNPRAATVEPRKSTMKGGSKVIITCAVTGSIHTPTMSPYLPITPSEIVDNAEVRRVYLGEHFRM
jgi:hypothetical protein